MSKTSTNKLKKTYSNKIAQLQNFLSFTLVFFALSYIILNAVLLALYGYTVNKATQSQKINPFVYVIYIVGSVLAISLWVKIIVFFVF
ncbi:hypothetical protein NPA08_04370 [Mycoplasmopsis citelli]|nr:hypothetical protein [Mycoplasmopsis citelli]UUD36155.1 hypothetical protein NPA08_04370 [Mycoplasmopsis citelli]